MFSMSSSNPNDYLSIRIQTEHLNRTFDYEPFVQTFITCLHREGLLEPIISRSKPVEAAAKPTEKKPARKKKTG